MTPACRAAVPTNAATASSEALDMRLPTVRAGPTWAAGRMLSSVVGATPAGARAVCVRGGGADERSHGLLRGLGHAVANRQSRAHRGRGTDVVIGRRRDDGRVGEQAGHLGEAHE